MRLTPEEERTLEVYNTTAREWSEKHATPNFWKKEMAFFKHLLPAGRILEIGSGGGRDAKELIALGYDYMGTDISTGLIKVAQEENPDTTFLDQSVYELSFPEGTQFDGFWASASLLHIPKARIDEALQNIRKFVRHDGIGFISVKQGEGERVEEDGRFYAYYSKEEFSMILANNWLMSVEKTKIHPRTWRKQAQTPWLCFFVKVFK